MLQKVAKKVLGARPIVVFRHRWQNDVAIPFMARRGWRLAKYIIPSEACLTPEYGFDEEELIKEAARKVSKATMASLERLASLWQQVRYLDKYQIQGSFVECGVWKGGTIAMAALAHQHSHRKPNRHLHLFDSFEGLPEPVAEKDGKIAVWYSKSRAAGKLSTIGKCVGTLEENKSLFKSIEYPEELLHYHIGWFQDTLPKIASEIGPISLLRLDGDWYESTKICLEHLYPKVVPGGVVVIDDYGHWEGCKKAVDEYLKEINEPVLLSHIDYSGRYWVKQS